MTGTTGGTQPGSTQDVSVSQFNHFGPALRDDPWPIFEALRDEGAICRSDEFGGFWILARYQALYEATRDPALFSSWPNGIPANPAKVRPSIPVELDPPEHAKFRQVLGPFFSPRAATTLEPRIRERAAHLIDQFVDRGSCDYVLEFAQLFPSFVFAEMMGLPYEDAPKFHEWEEGIIRPPVERASEVRAASTQAVFDYLSALLTQRRAQPARDDLIGALLVGEVDGRALAETEILDMCWLLFEAGLDTVQGALSNMVITLAKRPDLQEQLREDPSLVPAAIEELLRYESPVSFGRTVTRDAVFCGQQLKAGDRVLGLPGAADRDERYFSAPDVIDFGRDNKRHLAFGAGPHRCLGSHLARLELRVAVEELHRRIGPYRISTTSEVRRASPGFVRSVINLPLEFETAS